MKESKCLLIFLLILVYETLLFNSRVKIVPDRGVFCIEFSMIRNRYWLLAEESWHSVWNEYYTCG